MTEYRVRWEIDLSADSPEQAARKAYDTFTRPGSIAHIFDVSLHATPDVKLATVDLDRGQDTDTDTTEVVTFLWPTRHGECYDCGRPAAYYMDGEESEDNKACSVCAASHAADGSTITRIDTPDVKLATVDLDHGQDTETDGEPISSPPNETPPWQPDGSGVTSGGDVGGDRQASDSYAVRYTLPGRPGSLVTVAFYAEDVGSVLTLDVAATGFHRWVPKPPTYVVTAQTEFMYCSDPSDPGGTELWSDLAYEEFTTVYPTAEEAAEAAEQKAKAHTASEVTWDGLAPWEATP